MTCDDIEWLVDLLGTIALLESVITEPHDRVSPAVADVSVRSPLRSAFRVGNVDDGLYFDGAHWYSVKGKQKTDSYTAGYQIKGTAHFCQTFAAMMYTGADANVLVPGAFAANIRAAMTFWNDLFVNNPDLRKWFIKEIQACKHAGAKPEHKNMTFQMFQAFLVQVANAADSLVGCKEG